MHSNKIHPSNGQSVYQSNWRDIKRKENDCWLIDTPFVGIELEAIGKRHSSSCKKCDRQTARHVHNARAAVQSVTKEYWSSQGRLTPYVDLLDIVFLYKFEYLLFGFSRFRAATLFPEL